jgi:Signal recognition particle receptor beta subunit.
MSQSKDIKTRLRGVVFMVDTAALVDEATLRDAATYLHDVLSSPEDVQERVIEQADH